MKQIKFFIHSAGSILLAAALIRFVIAVLQLPTGFLARAFARISCYAVLMVGGIELVVAMICLFGRQTGTTIVVPARPAAHQLHGLSDWPVLGGTATVPAGRLHWQPDPNRSRSAWNNRIYHRGYSVLFVVGQLRGRNLALAARRQNEKNRCNIKNVLSFLWHPYQVRPPNPGEKIPCPQCQPGITLRKPDLLKMACFFCQEHIEFPAQTRLSQDARGSM